MSVWQYVKHPSKYANKDFHARCYSNYYAMDEIWRDRSEEVFLLFNGFSAMTRESFVADRCRLLGKPKDKPLDWTLNRIVWQAGERSFTDADSLSKVPDAWFKFRMEAIETSRPLHPKMAGPIKRGARLKSSSAFAAMYLALRATEDERAKADLGALAKTAFIYPQGF